MSEKVTMQKLFISSVILIAIGIIAFNFFDTGSLAKGKSGKNRLDELFRNLDVLKITHIDESIEITLRDIHGDRVRLSDFRGKIVFLNFWTTWCPTCRHEMSAMEKLHQKLKDNDFAMVTVNIQEPASIVKAFYRENKLTFTTLLDLTGEVSAEFNIQAIPSTFILDKTGRIIGGALGAREWDSKESIALFEHLTDKNIAASVLTSTH
jgi:peroxiredoxin